MPNRVEFDSNEFISLIYEGDQDESRLKQTIDESGKMMEQLKKDQKPVLVLVDLSHMGKLHTMARHIGEKSLRTQPFDRLAIFGWDIFTKYVVNLIIIASGKSDQAKFFNSRDEAINWLKEYKH